MTLPEPALMFARFAQDAETMAGARVQFQMLVTDLVKVQQPTASAVEGPGGRDWGLDTFLGVLNGRVFVWQSKFVLEWTDSAPQGQVRASFNQLMEETKRRGFTVVAWTLCVPCDLSPDQQRWFDGWARRMRSKHGVEIKLWNGTELRHQLMREDARHVRAEYFPHTVAAASVHSAERPAEPVATTEDHAQFDSALFVRQLEVAGYEENDAARGLFFATEALFRDYSAKGDDHALAALEELHLDIHDVWEQAFNSERESADENGRMPRLVGLVMEQAGLRPDPAHLRLRPVHKKGAAHRLVEAERAGWVTHWREVAHQHRAESAEARPSAAVEGEGAPSKPGGAHDHTGNEGLREVAGSTRATPGQATEG